MPHYRLYLLSSSGHIQSALDLCCEDDAEAIREAEVCAAGSPMEVWCGVRLVKVPAAKPG